MRILMVGHYPPHGGGVARHLDNLVRELRKRHEVHVLTYGPVKVREFEREFVHQLRVPPFYGLRGSTFAFAGARKIAQLHREFGFDIVHCHFAGTTSFSGALAKEKTGLPFVVTAHGSDLENTPKSPLGRFYVTRSLKRADVVIAVSHHLARLAKTLGAENVKVIPNGLPEFEGSEGGKREYVTFIGALRDYKSPETFVELAKFFPNTEFLVVGDGPLRKRLEAKAPPNVHFLGYRTDVEEILSRSILLVLPSKREGFGLVILEANSLGVPAIGRRVSAIPELIREGKNGLTFTSFDDLVDEVRALLESPKTARKMGSTGKRVAEKYSWEKVAEEVERVYSSLVG
ncbi:glycosyltransferase, family 4 [Thermococcus kodakarensis KOD1]|uniref:Glycosyltransferase, family 4 n=1 Tax=Thermococcus kodakarensis (strain ATCC BAA-918 / JCM 12380 / KOD1) TaxID=69014 RepID=Q5JIA3_THEKO|nr:glycosyltransferase family 4 protein [Thermococcus kodakarensis]WCN28932.1 glycosyltransferase family 4 protein [Thermococcus kodakarensis]WCN31234.1 glycosyltransferase family 4 protein [Thermococcus kodakarensis]BAD85138.1 glycosyltransferase, family 4 [Thermococcus kodakarensis KOD1]